MTLLVRSEARCVWLDAVQEVASYIPFSLKCLVIGCGRDAECEDFQGVWAELSGTDNSGAVLVRPDRHVAWRCRTLPSRPEEELRVAVRQIFDISAKRITVGTIG